MRGLERDIGGSNKVREPIDINRGVLTYKARDGKFSDIFEKSTRFNEQILAKKHNLDIKLVKRSLDLQYNIASEFFWIMEAEPYAVLSDVNHVLQPCFKNNLIALMSALYETKRGLYSFARPALRMVFESMIIAKFCATNHDSEIYDKWIDGEVVYFTNGVLKKILKPKPVEFSYFWAFISEYTHSSIFAMQPDTCIENVSEEIDLNFLLIHMLSECNFHILNSHLFTKSLKYYQSRYGNVEVLKESRTEIIGIYSELRKQYNKRAKQFVRDYKSSWEVSNV